MKRVITIMCVMALAIFAGNNAKAEDFSSLEGSHYYLLWLDADSEAEFAITPKIVQDLRVNWDAATNVNGEKALYIWENTYAANPATGKGSLGQIGGFLDFTAIGGWSGLGLCMRENTGGVTTAFDVDYTAMTDDYRFHMAAKSTMSKAHMIQVMGSATGIAKFSIGVGQMESTPNITPNFKTDGTWNIIDIPVSQLKQYGFTNRSGFKGNYFVILSGGAPNHIGVDAIYFYKPAPSGINDVKVDKLNVMVTRNIVEVLNATAPIEVYSVTGALVKKSIEPIFGVDELAKGAYVIKSGNAVAKVMIK
jgi:hypothetical protein